MVVLGAACISRLAALSSRALGVGSDAAGIIPLALQRRDRGARDDDLRQVHVGIFTGVDWIRKPDTSTFLDGGPGSNDSAFSQSRGEGKVLYVGLAVVDGLLQLLFVVCRLQICDMPGLRAAAFLQVPRDWRDQDS